MQKWEYMTISPILTKNGEWEPQVPLDKLGKEGWELAMVVPWIDTDIHGRTYSSAFQWIFKRPKE